MEYGQNLNGLKFIINTKSKLVRLLLSIQESEKNNDQKMI
jgi:hypothetical protein